MGRDAGRLASAATTMGRIVAGIPDKSGSSDRMRFITAGISPPPKACLPWAAKATTAPQAKTSAAGPTFSPPKTSGAM